METSLKGSSVLLAAIVTLLLIPANGSAQAPVRVPVMDGDRVRVTVTEGWRWTGTILSLEEDRITIRDEGGSETLIPVADIRTLELSRSQHQRFWQTLGITVGVAAGAGALLSAALWDPCTGFCPLPGPENREDALVWGAAGGAISATPLGMILGRTIKSERWSVATLPGSVSNGPSVSLVPEGISRVGFYASVPVGR